MLLPHSDAHWDFRPPVYIKTHKVAKRYNPNGNKMVDAAAIVAEQQDHSDLHQTLQIS